MPAFRRAPAYRGHVHIGFGLFAVRTIQSGELVLRMDRRLLRLYSPKQWEAFRGGFKHDAAIWRPASFFDKVLFSIARLAAFSISATAAPPPTSLPIVARPRHACRGAHALSIRSPQFRGVAQ